MTNYTRRSLMAAGASAGLLSPTFAHTQSLSKSTLPIAPYHEVETASGRLRGGTARGAVVFKGVPYGGSVKGAGRFKPAPPVTPWIGVRDALSLGAPAIQEPNSVYGEQEPAQDEDCLVLNVWTPAVNDGKKRPVLFYCHGGGFVKGSAGSTVQDGARLAVDYDVVVVASNHRLGLMGYLYLGDLHPDYRHGNVGMLDIVDSLKWVKTNISAFGGDANNVTIFGESGGGGKVVTLMAMPEAKGLFHKVVAQSGAWGRRMEKDQATETTLRLLRTVGADKMALDRLIHADAQTLLGYAQESERGRGPLLEATSGFKNTVHTAGEKYAGYWDMFAGRFAPVVDGVTLPHHPAHPAMSSISSDIPLMIGYCRDEVTLWHMGDPAFYNMDEVALKARLAADFPGWDKALYEAYRKIAPNIAPSHLYYRIGADRQFGNDSHQLGLKKAAQKAAPVYLYRYEYESNFAVANANATLMAGHATDIGSTFHNYDLNGLHGNGAGLKAASDNLSNALVSFARTGAPKVKDGPKWPRFGPKHRAVMRINSRSELAYDLDAPVRKVWDKLLKSERQ